MRWNWLFKGLIQLPELPGQTVMLKIRNGFTLIELMIVVAIIGILAAISIPKFAELIRKSEEGATKGSLSSIRSGLRVYYADNEGLYPSDNLACLTLNGKYLSVMPKVYVPGHHPKGVTVQTNDDWGMGAMNTADSGAWLYWNRATPLYPRRQGDVWIGCTHQDLKGGVWSSF